MNKVIDELLKLLTKPYDREEILILIQEARQNLLLATETDEGDYDQWLNGKLEFGNIRKYTDDINEMLQKWMKERNLKCTDSELMKLAESIKSFTMNQNII